MNTFNMTCEAVEATLPDYLDETLEAWVRSSVEEHLGQCLRCAGLVRDLRNIEREAAALPDLVPVRDLWPDIESRIGTPVVAFAPVVIPPVAIAPVVIPPVAIAPVAVAQTEPTPDISPTRDISPRGRRVPLWMGAAAAALVVVTAGTTYLLTSNSVREPTPRNVVTAPTITDPVVVEAEPDQSGVTTGSPDSSEPRSSGSGIRATAPGRRFTPTLASRSATEAVYNKEIVMLQAIMSWRKADLDPATAAIIDKNLRIIDAAIAQSKAALRRDPASSMLTDQLSHALDKKVELLRTAAMLPAST